MVDIHHYKFNIIVDEKGGQIPSFNLLPLKANKYLRWLSAIHDIHAIGKLIDDIESVVLGKKTEIMVTDGGDIELVILPDIVTLDNYFEEFEEFSTSTDSLLNFLRNWLEFIHRYQNCEIPNIIPSTKRDELVIVPISAVKQEFLANMDGSIQQSPTK